MIVWTLITSFGDAGVMVPAALSITGFLYAARARTAALLWLGLFLAAGLLVTATKIAFIGWGFGIYRFDFTGISGHSMMSMAVLPIALFLISGNWSRPRHLLVPLGALLALLVAVSRVELHDHSVAEALSGMLLGAAVAGGFLFLARDVPQTTTRSLPALSLVFAVILVAGYGRPAPAQDVITRVALALSGRDEPITRPIWYEIGVRKLAEKRERQAAREADPRSLTATP